MAKQTKKDPAGKDMNKQALKRKMAKQYQIVLKRQKIRSSDCKL